MVYCKISSCLVKSPAVNRMSTLIVVPLIREHKLALAIAATIGAMTGVVVGYLVYAVGRGAAGAIGFSRWLQYPIRFDIVWWAIFGLLVAIAIVVIKILLAK